MSETANSVQNKLVAEEKASLKISVKQMDGSPTGEEVELDPEYFGLEKNDHVLYLAIKAEMTNRRQGNHSTLTRSMVRGGGRKPWRQKGRGAARAGTNNSPIWRGGGITFGPQPHIHEMKLPKKVKRLAKKIALSVKAQAGYIQLVEDFDLSVPKTKSISDMMNSFQVTGKSALLMVDGNKPNVVKSCQNIPRLEIRDVLNASTYDILRARHVIISRSAVDKLVGGNTGEE
ncbi:MAG: 50S ribosomal protein L4 [Calditrichaeota bacterium]|nr:50S ribosomal protein L4 [Calditrichota bacterium]